MTGRFLTCVVLAAGLLFSAPAFSEDAPKTESWTQYQSPYVGEQNDLSNPNRTTDEVLSWTQKSVTGAMTFSPEELNGKIAEAKKDFVQQGWSEYAAYMKDSGLFGLIRDKGYGVTTIINGDATILGSGAVAGAYHWLIEAPLLITFLRQEDAGLPAPAAGGKFRLVVQVGRVAAAPGEDGLAIESWKVENLRER